MLVICIYHEVYTILQIVYVSFHFEDICLPFNEEHHFMLMKKIKIMLWDVVMGFVCFLYPKKILTETGSLNSDYSKHIYTFFPPRLFPFIL